MFILLTSEQTIKNEATILNQLFKAGLECLHLRKPSFDIAGYRQLLEQIEATFYKRIMIHEHHELCCEFHLKGIHIQEQPRIALGDTLSNYVSTYKKDNYWVSSSFHEPEELAACPINFDYHLLSPVFSSISKQGYEGRGFNVTDINKTIVGMGGINTLTMAKTFHLGYKGIGILGGVWNTGTPVESFITLSQTYSALRHG